MKLTKTERTALLKIRSAERTRVDGKRATPEEAQEEQRAALVRISDKKVFFKLVSRGLAEFYSGGAMKLTGAGRALLVRGGKPDAA